MQGIPTPRFPLGPAWFPRLFTIPMDLHWSGVPTPEGPCDFRGNNYMLFPAPAPGKSYSAYFDFESPYFNTLMGVYVIPLQGDTPSPEVVAELGNRDNLAWLRFMGDPDPRSEYELPIKNREVRAHDGGLRIAYEMSYRVHSGLGPNNPRAGVPPLLQSPDALSAAGAAAPRWRENLEDYPVLAQGFHGHLWRQGDFLMVTYVGHPRLTARDGKTYAPLTADPQAMEQVRQTERRAALEVELLPASALPQVKPKRESERISP